MAARVRPALGKTNCLETNVSWELQCWERFLVREETYCPPVQSETHFSEPSYDRHAADAEEPEREEDDEDAGHRPHDSHDVAVGDGVLGKDIRVENIGSLHSQRNQPCRRVTRRSDGHVHARAR